MKIRLTQEQKNALNNLGSMFVTPTDQGYEHVLAYKQHIWLCQAYGIRK